MKKILAAATLLAALLLGTEVSAQHYNYTRFGIVGGVTSSESKIKDFNSKSITQYHAGLLVEIPLGSGFGFQTGALYQMKGMQLDKMNDSSISDIGNSFETKVGFIEVPLQLQWGPDLVLFRPYGFVEPFVGYRLTDSSSEGAAAGLSDAMKKVEYGLSLGAGVEIGRVQVSGKYFWNFGEIYKSGTTAYDTVKDAINNGNNFNGFAVSLAFFF